VPSAPAEYVAPYSTKEVLRMVPVRRLLVTNVLLYVGIGIQVAALFKQVFDLTGQEIDLAWIGLAEFIPAALLVLVTGTVADRFPRKIVGVSALGGEFVAAVVLTVLAYRGNESVLPLFGVAFLYGTARAFAAPALRSMPPMVAPDGGLPKVIALYGATWTGAMIVGPALSGFLYSIDPWVAYATAATLIFAAMISLTGVTFLRQPERPDPDDKPTMRTAVEGLRFIRRTPILLGAISLDLFAVLFGGAVALLPVIADERLGVGPVAYGWLRAATGIGAALMAVYLAWRPVRRRVGPTLFTVVAIFGAGTIVLGLTRTYWVAFLALVVISAADMVSVFIRGSLVPLVTPPEKLGRVLAVENVFIGGSNELGAAESGFVAQGIGTPLTIIGGGFITLLVAVAWAFMFPALRQVDRFDDLDPTLTPSAAPSGVDTDG
jgi:MFS family permease